MAEPARSQNSDSTDSAELNSELRDRVRFLEKQIADLGDTLDKITNSSSWRITAPLRKLGQLKRALTPLFRQKTHEVSILSTNHLTKQNDSYVISGPTPYLTLEVTSRRPVSRWIVISYNLTAPREHLSFALYYDRGSGFQGEYRTFVTLTPGAHDTEVLALRGEAHRFRLDPFDREGEFGISDIKITEIGKAQVVSRFFKKHLRFLTLNPRRIFSLSRKAISLLRSGGLPALKAKVFGDRYSRNYSEWVRSYDTLTDIDKAQILRAVDALPNKPLISILIPTYNTPEQWLRRAIESVESQLYKNWELCIADDASTLPHVKNIISEYAAKNPKIKFIIREKNGHIGVASQSALSLASGEYVGFLDHDDELTPHALYMMADSINKNPSAGLLYSDEDKITTQGERFNPYFKSNWNPELLLSQNYICHFTVCKKEVLDKVGGFRTGFDGSQDWDLFLRVTETLSSSEIVHVPHILYHWRVIPESVASASGAKPYTINAAKKAVEEHLTRTNEQGEVSIIPSLSHLKVTFRVPTDQPIVSLIILTRDKVKLLRTCVESIRSKTEYKNFEIIIVDNGSVESETSTYFDTLKSDSRIKVLRIDEPFNFARLNNLAAKEAKGSVLGFLNNDLEVISQNWLSELLSHATRKGVGAVGARLWYPNDLLQHGGVILGIGGVAGHALKGIERGDPGYFNRAVLVSNFSAVTAACLLMTREVFNEVGGFDEENLSVAFNDIDLCLRVGQKGYRVIYTPYAELYHYESASRGYENTPKKFSRFERETEYMIRHWGEVLKNDPYYNPNLTLFSEDFSFAFPPRAEKPWKQIR